METRNDLERARASEAYLRRTVLCGALAVGVMALSVQACGAPPMSGARTVSVRDFGAAGDGRADDTHAFQRAHDSLDGGGGVLHVPAGTYRVDRVRVTNRGVRVELAPGTTIRKAGVAGPQSRGVFILEGLHDAGFTLAGGTIDLNGEGPMGIGVTGRIPNLYAPQTVATVVALAGPANAAVYGLRSSGITVTGVTIINSGETGLLFRNCGQVEVGDCTFRNLANYGVEISIVARDGDGGRGPMPRVGRCRVTRCSFEDIDDYGLGTGNGVGIGGGGAGAMGAFHDFVIEDCRFDRCLLDVHFEFLEGTWLQGVRLRRLESRDARKGGIGFVGVRDLIVENCTITNPGAAPSAALGPNWPGIHGLVLSSGFVEVTLRRLSIVDNRSPRSVRGGGGTIRRGSRRFTAPRASFAPGDVGRFIGIVGANPHGVCYVGRIVKVPSASEAVLDLPAGASVSFAQFAFGGTTREGMILSGGSDAILSDVEIVAGAAAFAGEPQPSALRIARVAREVRLDNLRARPPAGAAGALGLNVIDSRFALGPGSRDGIRGFARNWNRPPRN